MDTQSIPPIEGKGKGRAKENYRRLVFIGHSELFRTKPVRNGTFVDGFWCVACTEKQLLSWSGAVFGLFGHRRAAVTPACQQSQTMNALLIIRKSSLYAGLRERAR